MSSFGRKMSHAELKPETVARFALGCACFSIICAAHVAVFPQVSGIQLSAYVMLLDWTGWELRANKRGAIPDHLVPIVDRLGLNRSNWVETVRGFGRLFNQAAGRPSSLFDSGNVFFL